MWYDVLMRDVHGHTGCVRRCRMQVPMQEVFAAALLLSAQPVWNAKCNFRAALMPYEQHQLQRYIAKLYVAMMFSWTGSILASSCI